MHARKRGTSRYTRHMRAYPTFVPQGVPTHSHTILTTIPLHCPPLSETPILSNKQGDKERSVVYMRTTNARKHGSGQP